MNTISAGLQDPCIPNVLATAAFRFAHVTVQPLVFHLDENYQNLPQFPGVPLCQSYSAPWRVICEGQFT